MRGMRMKKLCSLLLALVLLAGCALGESAPEFRRMGDAALLPYLENSLYEQLVSDLDSSRLFCGKRTGGVHLSGVSGRAGVQLAGERLLRLYAFRIKRAVSGRKVHLHPW